MKLKLLEESTQWANLAERYIGILKSAVCKDMYEFGLSSQVLGLLHQMES